RSRCVDREDAECGRTLTDVRLGVLGAGLLGDALLGVIVAVDGGRGVARERERQVLRIVRHGTDGIRCRSTRDVAVGVVGERAALGPQNSGALDLGCLLAGCVAVELAWPPFHLSESVPCRVPPA